MSIYITIDGGTTSTRMRLLKNRKIIDTVRCDIGVLKASYDKKMYIDTIKNAISELISRNSEENIERILASGMITSKLGLCDLPHIKAPAGISELHNAMYETTISEISDIPFVFVRGVKYESEDLSASDMMRGEETELIGILNNEYGDCIYVLPGSHSKVIKTDAKGRIISFSTMLTGEMIAALSQNTILKDSVDLNAGNINKTYLLKGYDYAQMNGINNALFKVRILKDIFNKSKEDVYSFFIGVVLCDEILSILKDSTNTIVIGGREQIKNAMAMILREKTQKNIITIPEERVNYSTSIGMIKIYEYYAMGNLES